MYFQPLFHHISLNFCHHKPCNSLPLTVPYILISFKIKQKALSIWQKASNSFFFIVKSNLIYLSTGERLAFHLSIRAASMVLHSIKVTSVMQLHFVTILNSCSNEVFPTICHNDIQDITADLLSEWCIHWTFSLTFDW